MKERLCKSKSKSGSICWLTPRQVPGPPSRCPKPARMCIRRTGSQEPPCEGKHPNRHPNRRLTCSSKCSPHVLVLSSPPTVHQVCLLLLLGQDHHCSNSGPAMPASHLTPVTATQKSCPCHHAMSTHSALLVFTPCVTAMH